VTLAVSALRKADRPLLVTSNRCFYIQKDIELKCSRVSSRVTVRVFCSFCVVRAVQNLTLGLR
jgi:hypothetical protein